MNKERPTLLIIDDDPNIRMLLKHLLDPIYLVVTQPDAMKGMVWLRQHELPAMIILDLFMPGLNGIELLKNLKSSGYYRNIPVIVLTGYEDEATRRLCRSLGAEVFLSKPFKPEQIKENLEEVLIMKSQIRYF